MNEQELRALVRDVIARHTGAGVPPHRELAPLDPGTPTPPRLAPPHPSTPAPPHYAAVFVLPPTPDGRCIVEPAVTCNHCGYCKAYGH